MAAPKEIADIVEGYLRLTADGRWLYKGEPITHPGLNEILDTNFGRDDEGRYLVSLRLPKGTQRVLVEIEDTPYFVKDVDLQDAGGATLRLNDHTTEALDPSRLSIGAGGGTFTTVKGGLERARFLRQAELRLSDVLEEREGRLGVRMGGEWRPIRAER